jgi:hypothetical protein
MSVLFLMGKVMDGLARILNGEWMVVVCGLQRIHQQSICPFENKNRESSINK